MGGRRLSPLEHPSVASLSAPVSALVPEKIDAWLEGPNGDRERKN